MQYASHATGLLSCSWKFQPCYISTTIFATNITPYCWYYPHCSCFCWELLILVGHHGWTRRTLSTYIPNSKLSPALCLPLYHVTALSHCFLSMYHFTSKLITKCWINPQPKSGNQMMNKSGTQALQINPFRLVTMHAEIETVTGTLFTMLITMLTIIINSVM